MNVTAATSSIPGGVKFLMNQRLTQPLRTEYQKFFLGLKHGRQAVKDDNLADICQSISKYQYLYQLPIPIGTPGGARKHLTSIKMKHRNRSNLEPALILTLKKIRPPIEVLACQKQAQSSH
jgi:hypothetical protein